MVLKPGLYGTRKIHRARSGRLQKALTRAQYVSAPEGPNLFPPSRKSWPLRCPACRDPVLVDLPANPEPGYTSTAVCARGHSFIFQYDGAHVEVVGGVHVRGRHKS
jgi:hypothetical protein